MCLETGLKDSSNSRLSPEGQSEQESRRAVLDPRYLVALMPLPAGLHVGPCEFPSTGSVGTTLQSAVTSTAAMPGEEATKRTEKVSLGFPWTGSLKYEMPGHDVSESSLARTQNSAVEEIKGMLKSG